MHSEYYNKIMELVRKHKLGFLHNPGGGEFTFSMGSNIKNIQIPFYDDKEDYEILLKGLKERGLEE